MQRQYVSSGMCNKVITYGARGSETDAREALGAKAVSHIISAVWWNAQLGDKGLNKTFVDAFKAKYDKDPEWYQATTYEAARALFTAISKAGSVDSASRTRRHLADHLPRRREDGRGRGAQPRLQDLRAGSWTRPCR
jgi:branched-chain amino acid transport system substrate-binding protein